MGIVGVVGPGLVGWVRFRQGIGGRIEHCVAEFQFLVRIVIRTRFLNLLFFPFVPRSSLAGECDVLHCDKWTTSECEFQPLSSNRL